MRILFVFGIDLMLIEGMAAFMDQRIDGSRDIVLIIVGRDADIMANPPKRCVTLS